MTFEERIRRLERQIKDQNKKICCIQNNTDCPPLSANEGNAITCEPDGLYVGASTPNVFNGIIDYGDPDGLGLGEGDITQFIGWYNGYANNAGLYGELDEFDMFAADPNFNSYSELWLFNNQNNPTDYRARVFLGAYSDYPSTGRFHEESISFYSDNADTSVNRMEFLVGGTVATGGVNSNRYAVVCLRHNSNGKYLDLGVASNSGDDRAVTLILGKFYNGEANADIYDTDGAIIYDSGTNKFRAREGGVWKDVIAGGSGITWPLESPNSGSNQYKVVTADGNAGLGFTIEAGGWSSIYLGGLIPYCPPGTNDKGNIYIGILAGQGRSHGGDFNMMLGYQSALGAPVASYKFYLAQGANNHLMYGDFLNGGLSIKKGIYVGMPSGDWTTMPLPTARVEIQASDGSAGSGPIKFTAGTNLVTPVNGVMEFDGTNLYFTTGGVRKTVTLV